jgi:hypothetical protein
MANNSQKKVCRLEGFVPGHLETWRLTLLGWSYGYEEILLSIYIFLYQGWISDTFLGR